MKARNNFWVDLGIAIAFVVSAISGLVFLIPLSWTEGMTHILGLTFRAWNTVHTWSSLAMMAGVAVHLALHWRWIVSMARRELGRK